MTRLWGAMALAAALGVIGWRACGQAPREPSATATPADAETDERRGALLRHARQLRARPGSTEHERAGAPVAEPPTIAPRSRGSAAGAPRIDAGPGLDARPSPAWDARPLPGWAVAMSQRQAARQAFQAGDYEDALGQALAVVRARPRDKLARRIAALAACELGLQDIAQDHAEMLDRRRFEHVQRYCRHEGIALLHPYEPR